MKNRVIAMTLLKILAIFFIMAYFFKLGQNDVQRGIEYRALKHTKLHYTNQDMEIIIFGEVQE